MGNDVRPDGAVQTSSSPFNTTTGDVKTGWSTVRAYSSPTSRRFSWCCHSATCLPQGSSPNGGPTFPVKKIRTKNNQKTIISDPKTLKNKLK